MTRFTVPREHGAYIILIASWLWGIIFSPVVDMFGVALVFVIVFTLFLIEESLRMALRSRARGLHPVAIILFVISVVAIIVLLLRYPSVLIICLPVIVTGAVYFVFARKGADPYSRSVIGFVLFSFITPTVMLASGSSHNLSIAVPWLGVFLFSISSVLVVGIRLHRRGAILNAAIFHGLFVALMLLYALESQMSMPLLAMSSVAVSRYVLVMAAQEQFVRLPLKAVGIVESLVTTIAIIASALLI